MQLNRVTIAHSFPNAFWFLCISLQRFLLCTLKNSKFHFIVSLDLSINIFYFSIASEHFWLNRRSAVMYKWQLRVFIFISATMQTQLNQIIAVWAYSNDHVYVFSADEFSSFVFYFLFVIQFDFDWIEWRMQNERNTVAAIPMNQMLK